MVKLRVEFCDATRMIIVHRQNFEGGISDANNRCKMAQFNLQILVLIRYMMGWESSFKNMPLLTNWFLIYTTYCAFVEWHFEMVKGNGVCMMCTYIFH